MLLVSILLFIYSFYCFAKCVGRILRHDVGSKVYGDYHSDKREDQRTGILASFAKSVIAFILAGCLAALFI